MKSLLDLLQIIYAKPKAQTDREKDSAHKREITDAVNLLHYKPNEQLSSVSV